MSLVSLPEATVSTPMSADVDVDGLPNLALWRDYACTLKK